MKKIDKQLIRKIIHDYIGEMTPANLTSYLIEQLEFADYIQSSIDYQFSRPKNSEGELLEIKEKIKNIQRKCKHWIINSHNDFCGEFHICEICQAEVTLF